jgi:ATP dependent DNA ligase domain
MVNGQLTDSTRGRRPVIWFSTCCCAPAEHLPASSNPAFHLPPSVRRAVPGDPRDQARRVSTDGSAGPIGIRLLTRNGFDWALRYPLIVEAVNRLKVRSCPIDGEAVACDENGLAVFERLRRKPSGKHVFLYAFDLLELNGQDLRREPLETRKATLREPAAWKPSGAASERTPRPRWRERIPARMQAWPRRHRVEASRLALPLRSVEGLGQEQEPGCTGRETGGRGRMGQKEMAITPDGKNRIMIFGPKTDGTGRRALAKAKS